MVQGNPGRQLPIEWYVPETTITRYANNFVVQHTENEFFISFFEIVPPVVLGTPEQVQDRLQRIHAVDARCVTRIVLTSERAKELAKILQTNLRNYEAKRAQSGHLDGAADTA